MNYNDLKSERKTIRLTEATKSFVESFGAEGDNFSASFDKMVGIFHGERGERLRSDANNLENRICDLRQEEQNIYREFVSKMRDALSKMESVQKCVDRLHLDLDKNEK